MRVAGVVMLVLGLMGLGGSLHLSHCEAVRRLRESQETLSQKEEAVRQRGRGVSDLRSRREMVAQGLETAIAQGAGDQAQQAKAVLDGLDTQLAQDVGCLRASEEQLASHRPRLENDVRRLRLAESIIKGGYCSCALLPAALPLIIGSFLRVGASLRPQNPLVRHPFLALFGFALIIIGLLLLAFAIRHAPSAPRSDLRSLFQFLWAALFLFLPPVASASVGAAMLVALFRAWDVDEVG